VNVFGDGVPVLSGINLYPIKSCAGVSVPRADLEDTGLAWDRRWMLVDEEGKSVTQRRYPRMALISPSFGPDRLVVRAPGMPDLVVPFRGEEGERIDVEVWGDWQRGAPVGEEADRWFGRFLGLSCRLVRKPYDDVRLVDSAYARDGDQTSFADGFPLLLISETSLEDLNGRLESPVPMNRFRPNLVVRGCAPYAEDGWEELRVGEAIFRVAEPCARCAVTTVNQESGERGKEPLRTLATYRKVDGEALFGRNLIHASLGAVRVGDPVRATPRRNPPR
jgi:uncharacterized protein YcbX